MNRVCYSDICDERYGKLTVVKFLYKKNGKPYVLCICDCGNSYIANYYALRSGNTKSCGCYRKNYITNKNTSHGKSNTKIYHIWKSMRQRCNNKNSKDYKYYGEIGIQLDENWNVFENFYNDMYDSYIEHIKLFGESDTSLDRIDPSKNYCKENCRWATWKEQNNSSHKRKFRDN